MDLEKLRDVIIDQAKYFLAKAAEFYPFGAMINREGEVVPLGIKLDNDHPQSQEVIEILEKAIIPKLKNGEAKLAGIGTDVFYKPIDGAERKSAIQVRILEVNGKFIDYYLPYRNEGQKFAYEKLFSETGTLNFLRVI
jgi:hypothetical protein